MMGNIMSERPFKMPISFPVIGEGIRSKTKIYFGFSFENADHLDRYDAIMKALSDVNVFNAGKKRDEAERVLGQLLPDLYKLQAQSKLIDEQAKALREAIKEKDALLEEQDTELFALGCKIDALQAEKDRAVATIEMIPPEVRRALEQKLKRHGKER